MGLYLYCVLPADVAEPELTGIDGAPVRAFREADVTVWLGDCAAAPRPDLDRIRAHNRVVQAALATGATPVPIRFGQVLADEAALVAHLAQRDYHADLARVAGAVEFGIRVLDPAAAEATDDTVASAHAAGAAEAPGTAYLRAVAKRVHTLEARRERALEVARRVDDELAAWVRERRIEPSEQPPGATVAHLVQTDAVAAYGARARDLTQGDHALHLVLTGPWPPYSFVA